MKILGISSLDNDTCVSLIDGAAVRYAVMEERLTHIKHQNGFPHKALKMLFDMTGIRAQDIDCVAYPFLDWRKQKELLIKSYLDDLKKNITNPHNILPTLSHQASFLKWSYKAISDHRRFNIELEKNLTDLGLMPKLQRVEHQLSHAAAAFYTSGFERALILTLDWYGDGLAGSVSLGSPAGIERCHSIDYPHSLGMFYAQVTGALGFKMCHHEGKIVGLAAFGDPSVLYDTVKKKFEETEETYRYINAMDFTFCQRLAHRYHREEVAAAYQKVLEDVVTKLVRHYLVKYQQTAVVLAGGVAANVKLNQRVHEVDQVEKIFIHPAMGDDGSGTGAALYLLAKSGIRPEKIKNVFFGPEYSHQAIEAELKRFRVKYQYYEDIEDKVAEKLVQNKVVARFNGRMEYGPRSLGNRSILYSASDPSVNDWLNKRLNRTEFMPFAPATLFEYRDQCYIGVSGAENAAQYMTITFDCKPFMQEKSPAAVHVDGTARPQFVTPESNPGFYRIIKKYHELTGIPSVINTSFNMHEAPIVCTPEDAITTYLDGKLDHLAIGNFLV
ncbi:MAG: carbamoyltransferase [Candidatus Schekmanbacteria bacterium]|nr:carbamoyltransferase [Candidatus Schekmanbacteria bacterium]